MIKLSSFEGGGGYFSIESFLDGTVTGQGELLSLPEAPSGKFYKLCTLRSSTNSQYTGITLVVDGITLEDKKGIASSTGAIPSGGFYVSETAGASNGQNRQYAGIICKSFSFSRDPGLGTNASIRYAYQIGSFK